MDDDNSKSLSLAEFKKAVKDYRVEIPDYGIEKVFRAFDVNRDGTIDYDEFLRTLRGELNEFRRNLTLRAFKVMDKDGCGVIDLNDI
jgi:Ca2+-binding EF-hand superfamily protein